LLAGLLVVAALAAVLLVVVRPFSSGPAAEAVILGGPLGPAGNLSTICEPTRLGNAVTIGIQGFSNRGDNTVTIDRMTLGAARDIRLTGAFIVPGRYLVGAWGTFPPPARQLMKGVQWASRRHPAGTRVRPHGWVGVVAGVEPTGHATGKSAGIVVWYHDGGKHYELQTNVRILLKVAPARCI
jgi:hypothetical protein